MSKKTVTAAIIATGNEVVSGQILNTNTQYLAQELSGGGVEVFYHFSVLDRRADLEEILSFLKDNQIDEVFVIGGLGPTSDDLTRYIVADFFEQELSFHEEAWAKVTGLLESRSVSVKESHKKQCYFPDKAELLLNTEGTAQGFRTEKDGIGIWCIPGPPRECRAVYESSIRSWVKENVRAKTELLTWQCIGVPESDVSDKIEAALKDCSYEFGFRASPPIVEVKLWVPSDHMGGVSQVWIDAVEEVVKPSLYSRQNQDYLKESLEFLISEGEVDLVDEFSKGYVYESLLASFKGEVPSQINFSTKSLEHGATDSITIVSEDGVVELSYESIDQNFVVRMDLNEEKALSNKRYRKTKCAELFKGLHENLLG